MRSRERIDGKQSKERRETKRREMRRRGEIDRIDGK
jgi:hypothetical protein